MSLKKPSNWPPPAPGNNGREDRTAHVGFYLIDKGQSQLGRLVKVRWPWRKLVERCIHRFPLIFYGGGICLFTALATFGFMAETLKLEVPEWKLIFFTLVFLLCASQLAVALMNWFCSLLLKPCPLPRMDFSTGIPPDCRTMVVVPTMLNSLEGIDRLIETLEIHHLANRDEHLHFALLTDFRDAPAEILPGDEALLQRVRTGIEMLNRKYSFREPEPVFLVPSPASLECRRSLVDGLRTQTREAHGVQRPAARRFARMLFRNHWGDGDSVRHQIRHHARHRHPIATRCRPAARRHDGSSVKPSGVRCHARDCRRRLQHPATARRRKSAERSRRSWFVRLFAGDAGIDPYTREVSDVYQDVFQEGSFIGKGIYDVDAFERAMHGRFPENTVLSHDLLEACHARSALVSDVEFYEEYPSRYNVDIDRRHRWIRGDWQITQWLLPRVPGPNARRIANPLSGLSQWKIFDNLRRSLVPVALMILLVGPWLMLPELGGCGSLLVIVLITLPGLLASLVNLLHKPADLPWAMHLRIVVGSSGRQLCQIVLALAFLPYDAFISVDAIGRTLVAFARDAQAAA